MSRGEALGIFIGRTVLGFALMSVVASCASNRFVADTSFSAGRAGLVGIETLHDYEASEHMAYAGLAQLEAMHALSPDNEDGLLLLVRGWTGLGQGYIMDDFERAFEKREYRLADYHRARARGAFDRAIFFGKALIAQQATDFAAATQDARTMRAWLEENFDDPEHAEQLLWLGAAWLGRVAAQAEKSAAIANLWIGVMLVEHSVRLDPELAHGLGHTILGAYHARGAVAELDQSKAHFDKALEINEGKFLLTHVLMAKTYFCQRHDQASYDAALDEVLEAGDVLPIARLQNVVAKRFAARYRYNSFWQEECGFDVH